PAGFNDAEDGRISARPFLGSRSEADPPCDDRMPECCLGIVVEPFTVPDPRRCGILTRLYIDSIWLFRVKNAGAGAASQISWPACRTSRLSIFPRCTGPFSRGSILGRV